VDVVDVVVDMVDVVDVVDVVDGVDGVDGVDMVDVVDVVDVVVVVVVDVVDVAWTMHIFDKLLFYLFWIVVPMFDNHDHISFDALLFTVVPSRPWYGVFI
jgi:hypothetical protein